MTDTSVLTIGAVARQARVPLDTLRYYERRGLLPAPPRTTSGYRQYPADAVRRVRFIKRAQALGFTLEEIAELLALRVTPEVGCDAVERRTSPLVELVYFAGCPHVDSARVALRAALARAGLALAWEEWDQTLPDAPDHVRGLGSPTILVAGRDVTGAWGSTSGRACRADGIPAPEAIVAALVAAGMHGERVRSTGER